MPLIVMVRFPVVANFPTWIVTLEVPAPVIEVGVNLTVTRLPCPEADNVIAELNPPVTDEVTVTVSDVPLLTVIEEGEALIENPGVVPVTVRFTVVV